MLAGMCAMAIHVGDTHMYLVACVGTYANAPLHQDDRAIAKDQLRAVGADAQPLPKAKGRAEPVARLPHILIRQRRNHRSRWHGTILDHAVLSPFRRYCSERTF